MIYSSSILIPIITVTAGGGPRRMSGFRGMHDDSGQ